MQSHGFQFNKWLTVGDNRFRESHVANDGIIVGIGEQFPSVETYPGENSINCRCHLEYVEGEV